jgi:large subunit ribosomal protein L6
MTGVTEGFEKRLEITGVGYRAQVQGKTCSSRSAFQHDVVLSDARRASSQMSEADGNRDHGIDKQRVGQVAAEIREFVRRSPTRARAFAMRKNTIVRKEGKKK